MASCYFYLQNLERCSYYTARMQRDIVEGENSEIKNVYRTCRFNYIQTKLGPKTTSDSELFAANVFDQFD